MRVQGCLPPKADAHFLNVLRLPSLRTHLLGHLAPGPPDLGAGASVRAWIVLTTGRYFPSCRSPLRHPNPAPEPWTEPQDVNWRMKPVFPSLKCQRLGGRARDALQAARQWPEEACRPLQCVFTGPWGPRRIVPTLFRAPRQPWLGPLARATGFGCLGPV